MSKPGNNDPSLLDSLGRERDGLRRYRLVLGCSIVVYLGLAVLVARWLPDYSVIAWAFLAFGAHSVLVLLSGRGKQGP
jgi:hypothetical protein